MRPAAKVVLLCERFGWALEYAERLPAWRADRVLEELWDLERGSGGAEADAW